MFNVAGIYYCPDQVLLFQRVDFVSVIDFLPRLYEACIYPVITEHTIQPAFTLLNEIAFSANRISYVINPDQPHMVKIDFNQEPG